MTKFENVGENSNSIMMIGVEMRILVTNIFFGIFIAIEYYDLYIVSLSYIHV
jgi:hypothetical protein